MIQARTIVNSADNTGARTLQCVHILGASRRRYAGIGDVVTLVIKTAQPYSLVKKGEVAHGVIVRQKKATRREDGSYIRFDDNAAVVLEGSEPKGGRVFGPVPRELRERGFTKIVSLASEVV